MMHESMSDERMGAYEKKENRSERTRAGGAKKKKKEKGATACTLQFTNRPDLTGTDQTRLSLA
jgi:hypothetical protein